MDESLKRMTSAEYAAAEVTWYRKNGRYPMDRIKRDGTGAEYVVGDTAWNRDRWREFIEPDMNYWISEYARQLAREGGGS